MKTTPSKQAEPGCFWPFFILALACVALASCSTTASALRETAEDTAAEDARDLQDRLEDRRPPPALDANHHWPRDRDAWMLDLAP